MAPMYSRFASPLALAILCKVIMTIQLRRYMHARIPNTPVVSSSVWPMHSGAPVYAAFEDTVRYAINGPNSDAEWSSLTPEQGLVYLGDEHRAHSIAMFHELRCLNVVRQAIVHKMDGNDAISPLVRHCLNYVRQMIFCRSNTMLNGYAYHAEQLHTLPSMNQCNDWMEIYKEVERNQDEHRRWMGKDVVLSGDGGIRD